jgi:segregation and condensation protein B
VNPTTHAELEAVLFLADEPVNVDDLAVALDLTIAETRDAIASLGRELAHTHRGVEIRQVGDGYRMFTADTARHAVERFVTAGRAGRLTQAALETLAVIAYKQPITRSQIGEIRGVNVDAAVRNLVSRGLVAEAGRDATGGQGILYVTTTVFLERLGIRSLDELVPLTEFLNVDDAPDEPAADAIHDARRRIAEQSSQMRFDDPMPAPQGQSRQADMVTDALTDDLDAAAQHAISRLRNALAAMDALDRNDSADDADEVAEQTKDSGE